MATACRGVCSKYKSIGTAMQLKYQEGKKRCSFCGIFMECDGVRGPCCHMILRTKARNKLSKIKRFTNNYQ
ncbi:MAG: hypothetical protein OEM28_13160 [Nitrosopumilus sp.]|nr:hypothetical protein [Nitrosopumilus sp.]